MAEPEVRADDQNRPPPNGGGGDELPDDPQALKAKVQEWQSKYGTLLNESKKTKEDRKKLADALKTWNQLAEEHGVEPDQVKALLAAQADSDLQKARSQGEIDKLLDNQAKKLQRDLETKDGTISSLQKTIEALTIDATLDVELDKIVEARLKRGPSRCTGPRSRSSRIPRRRMGSGRWSRSATTT